MASFANRSIGFGSSPRNGNALPEVGSFVYREWERTQRHCGAFKSGLQKEKGCGGPFEIRWIPVGPSPPGGTAFSSVGYHKDHVGYGLSDPDPRWEPEKKGPRMGASFEASQAVI